MNYLNEKGNALVLTIFTLILVSVLGFSLLTVTANSNKTTVNERFDQSIYYIAEAGLNLEKSMLYSTINSAFDDTVIQFNSTKPEDKIHFNFTSTFDSYFCLANPNYCIGKEKQLTSFQQQYNKNPISETVVLKNCTGTTEMDCTFIIKSSGFFQDQPSKTRDLEQTVKISSKTYLNNEGNNGNGQTPENPTSGSPGTLPFSNLVALSLGEIKTSGNADIHGNIASNTNKSEVKKEDKLHGELIEFTDPININNYLPPFPTTDFNKLNLPKQLENLQNSNVYLEKLSGAQTINIGSNDRTIYVDTLDLKEGITVEGTGKLTIIVKNTINLEGNISRADKDPNKLNIYYQGTQKEVSTSTKDNGSHSATNIDGSIHILNSELNYEGGKILGNIYYYGEKDMKVNGNSKGNANYIVAPNAAIQMNGNADFYGAIIAKEININGNHDLHYSSNMLVPLPNSNPSPSTPSIPSVTVDDKPTTSESDVEEK